MAPTPGATLQEWYNVMVRNILQNQVAEFKSCLYG